MKLNKLKSIVLILISIILSIIIIKYLKLVHALCFIIKILAPVFIGFIYAWLLNPLINYLSKNHNRSLICIIIFLLIIISISLILYLLIPTIYKEVHKLVESIPSIIDLIKNKISNYNLNIDFDNLNTYLINNIPSYILTIIKKTIKYMGILVIGLILGLYASIDYDKIILFIYKVFPLKHKPLFIDLTQKISSEVHKCVNSTILVAAIVFIADSICFLILGLSSPILLGFVCGLTDLIPYIGPYIGGAIAVLVALSKSKTLCILTIICCICVQIIENNLLQPLIMSRTIKISPIFIMVGLLVFGNLFGIIGMILASPIIAMLKVIIDYINTKTLQNQT